MYFVKCKVILLSSIKTRGNLTLNNCYSEFSKCVTFCHEFCWTYYFTYDYFLDLSYPEHFFFHILNYNNWLPYILLQFLTKAGLECSDLETICVKDCILTNDCKCHSCSCSCSILVFFPHWHDGFHCCFSGIDKIIGFALTHQLKSGENPDPSSDVQFALSSKRFPSNY
jgi:hypothetical protein